MCNHIVLCTTYVQSELRPRMAPSLTIVKSCCDVTGLNANAFSGEEHVAAVVSHAFCMSGLAICMYTQLAACPGC